MTKKEYNRAYYLAHRDSAKARSKAWRESNSQRHSDYCKGWRRKNSERVQELNRRHYQKRDQELNRVRASDWYWENQDKAKNRISKWKKENPESVRVLNGNRRAKKKGASGFCSLEQKLNRIAMFGGLCGYCGVHPYEHIDHVIALSHGGTNWPSNLRPACAKCNLRKQASRDWKSWAKKSSVNTNLSAKTNRRTKMANLPKEMADGVGKAKTAGGGNYMQHGDYILMVKKWFYQRVQDRCIITEFLVIDSRQKVIYEGTREVRQQPNAIGSDGNVTINFDGKGKLSAEGNARAMILGLFNYTEGGVSDQVVSETLAEVCDEQKQPAKGMLMALSTYAKEVSSRPGNFITAHNWSCVAKPPTGLNSPEMIAARLAALAKSPQECVRVAWQQLGKADAPVFEAPAASQEQSSTAAPSGGLFGQAPSTAAAPSLPTPTPEVPSAPSIPVVDPFAGWTVHPQDANFYFRGQEVKSKADLLAAAGK